MPFSHSSTSVTTYIFEHQNSSGPGKSLAFKTYLEFLLFVVLELLVPRTSHSCPPQFFCLIYIGIFQSIALSRRELKLFMRRIRKVLLFSFSTAKSNNFMPRLVIFDPLFCSSFKVYVTDSFHYKETLANV